MIPGIIEEIMCFALILSGWTRTSVPSMKYSRGGSIAKFKYKSYGQYLLLQREYSQKRKFRTRRREKRRQWVIDNIRSHNVEGRTVLCVGARDDSEVATFINNGYKAMGIDLFETQLIIECDMSRMYEHPTLKNMKFDIVIALEALEHCLDFDGLLQSLRLVCAGYFVCMFPILDKPDWWDCNIPDFLAYLGTDEYDDALAASFPGFEIVINEVHKPQSRIKRGYFILKRTTE